MSERAGEQATILIIKAAATVQFGGELFSSSASWREGEKVESMGLGPPDCMKNENASINGVRPAQLAKSTLKCAAAASQQREEGLTRCHL